MVRANFCLLFLALPCCIRRSQSDVSHVPLSPVREPAWLQWRAADEETYRKAIGAMTLGDDQPLAPPLAPDHVLNQRLQVWSDVIDSTLRQRYPDALQDVPKPVTRVLPQSGYNAFEMRNPTCFKVSVVFEGVAGTERDATAVYGGDAWGFASGPDNACDNSPVTDPARVQEAVAFHNRNFPRCPLRWEGGRIVVSAQCPRPADARPVSGAGAFLINSSSNYISFLAGFYELFEHEEELVGVLAHELGHYYHAHGIKEMKFIYRHDDANPAAALPSPVPELQPFADQLARLSVIPVYERIEGQEFHTALFRMLAMFADDYILQSTSPESLANPACQEYRAFLSENAQGGYDEVQQRWLQYGKFDSMPDGPISAEQKSLYLKLESLFKPCAALVRFDGGRNAELRQYLEDALGGFIDASFHFQGPGQEPPMDGRIPADAKDLLQVARIFSERVEGAYRLWNDLNARVASERLGFYTNEQEADDLATEWLADIGVSPGFWKDTWLHYLEKTSASSSPIDQFSAARCRELAARDFQEGGKEVFVPVGLWNDTHHSHCYRVFNITREVRAHATRVRDVELPALPGGSWPEIQALAQKAIEDRWRNATVPGQVRAAVPPQARHAESVRRLRGRTLESRRSER